MKVPVPQYFYNLGLGAFEYLHINRKYYRFYIHFLKIKKKNLRKEEISIIIIDRFEIY